MNDRPLPQSEFISYQTEEGCTRIQCRIESETVWLSQKLMAELLGKDVCAFNEHIQNVFAEGKLVSDSAIQKCRIARQELDFHLDANRYTMPATVQPIESTRFSHLDANRQKSLTSRIHRPRHHPRMVRESGPCHRTRIAIRARRRHPDAGRLWPWSPIFGREFLQFGVFLSEFGREAVSDLKKLPKSNKPKSPKP